jgi:radical SAM superfamily enzyme YgiQ (UPF0313 family)
MLLRRSRRIAHAFIRRLDTERPDIVLVSTYLMYYDLCEMIGRACAARGIPVLVGGAYFSDLEVASQWADLEGVCGLVCGEVELDFASIVRAAVRGDSLDAYPAVRTAESSGTHIEPPLQDLDALPFPDYSDFPWQRYPTPIVPLVTGRGCGWGVCTFCSDITSTVHRTYRSRSLQNVLEELTHQHERHETSRFVFSDLMLNSSREVWHGLLQRFPRIVPGAEWIASVHVTDRDDNGLDRASLVDARAAGMVRLTTGFESAGRTVLRRMRKGTSVERTSQFVADASEAGISVRLSLIIGYPGETADDVESTAAFLEAHEQYLERVQLNRFQIMVGTAFYEEMQRSTKGASGSHPAGHSNGFTSLTVNLREAQVHHRSAMVDDRDYRRAISRLLRAVHAVNRKPIRPTASAFEGVM